MSRLPRALFPVLALLCLGGGLTLLLLPPQATRLPDSSTSAPIPAPSAQHDEPAPTTRAPRRTGEEGSIAPAPSNVTPRTAQPATPGAGRAGALRIEAETPAGGDEDAATTPGTGRLHGRVVDEDGEPVSGVEVAMTLAPLGPNHQVRLRRRDGVVEVEEPGRHELERVRTDALGRFAFAGIPLDERPSLQLTPPEPLLERRVPVEGVRAGEDVDVGDVTVQVACTIRGVVVDPRGLPQADATVRLKGQGGFVDFGPEGEEGESTQTMSITLVGSAPVESMLWLQGRSTKTDAEGRFEFERVPPRALSLVASAPGFQAARRDVEPRSGETLDDVRLALAPGLSLTVRVVSETNQPIVGAEVSLSLGFAGGSGQARTTDAEGRARWEGLASREVQLHASAPGRVPYDQSVRIEPDRVVELVLPPAVRLTGRVVGSDGSEVAAGFVAALIDMGGGQFRSNQGAELEEGRFNLEGVRPGAVRLQVHAEGWHSKVATVDVPEGVVEFDVGEITVEALARLTVRVLDPAGEPVAGALLTTTPPGVTASVVIAQSGDEDPEEDAPQPRIHLPGGSARTGADGVGVLEGLDPGIATVRVLETDYPEAFAEAEVRAGTEGALTITLSDGARVAGRLETHTGAPAAGETVYLQRKGLNTRGEPAETDATGAFDFARVAPGDYRVHADAPLEGTPEWFTVTDGAETYRTLRLAPTSRLELTLRAASGAPLVDARVVFGAVFSGGGSPRLLASSDSVRTDAQGRAVLEGLAKGVPNSGVEVSPAEGGSAIFRVELAQPLEARAWTLPDEASGTIQVVVEDGLVDGAEVGAPVHVERLGEGALIARQATTDARGRVEFAGLPPGRYRVEVRAPGRARARAEEEGGEVRLRLEEEGVIQLEVSGTSSGAMSMLRVEVQAEDDPADRAEVWAQPDAGPVSLRGLRRGAAYRVEVGESGREASARIVAGGADDPPTPLELR